MAERHFTRHEAEELLPTIVGYLGEARDRKTRIDELDKELTQAVTRIMFLGGSIPPYSDLGRKKSERDQTEAKMLDAVNKIQETGCVVKDLDMGLIDFPCLLEGREVYLCWKLGEERIGFWHGLDEGYAGRKPLDDSAPGEPPPRPKRIN